VAAYESPDAAHEAGLAILAMGQAYWLLPFEGRYLVFVASGRAELVRRELESISQLGRRRVRASAHGFSEFRVSAGPFWVYAILLIGVFLGQPYADLKTRGGIDAERMVLSGEWWRAVTALTLHGDVVHLVSNLVSGLGFAFFVARFFGAASGWCLILLAGAMGNALNAWVQYPEGHLSIGASTAVFGALGIMTGVGMWAAWGQPGKSWTFTPWLLPAFGGLTLLGLLGIGDGMSGTIDVAAHISGFLCGGLLGLLGAVRQSVFLKLEKWGAWIGCLSLSVIGISWAVALSR
jgi:membrane associated rhomboid family serine protease